MMHVRVYIYIYILDILFTTEIQNICMNYEFNIFHNNIIPCVPKSNRLENLLYKQFDTF